MVFYKKKSAFPITVIPHMPVNFYDIQNLLYINSYMYLNNMYLNFNPIID